MILIRDNLIYYNVINRARPVRRNVQKMTVLFHFSGHPVFPEKCQKVSVGFKCFHGNNSGGVLVNFLKNRKLIAMFIVVQVV